MKMIHFTQSSYGVIFPMKVRRGVSFPASNRAVQTRIKEHLNMSLSKEQVTVGAEQPPRRPNCTRCRHHGVIVPQKGHMKLCPFLQCDCWKCSLITQRTRVTALERSLQKAQNKEHRARVKPMAEETCAASAPDGAAYGPPYPPTDGPSERGGGLRSRRAAGGEHLAGPYSRTVQTFASSEERPSTAFNASCFGEFGQAAPLPLIHFPWTSGFPSSYGPCANLLVNMPWLPPGLYSDGLRGPPMFPGALHYPSPLEPGPPADCRPDFFTLQPALPLPEPLQEELKSRQHPESPPTKHTERDVVELD